VEKRAKASESVTGEVSPPDHGEAMRIAEALLFASAAPLSADELRGRLPEGADIEAILRDITELYSARGVHLMKVSGRYAFRTAGDLAYVMARDVVEPRRLSRAAMETLAIVAYHQPVTRAEIEEIRGVATSKGTLDTLLETGWVRLRGRRKSPGRPVTYGTTPLFLDQFGRPGDGDGELDEPTAIAVDLDRGTVFVADTGNQRVSVFDVDGGFIRTFGLAGTGDGEFTHPQGIAVNGSGTVFVTDFANPRVQAFNQDGQFLSAFGEGGSDQAGSLDSPVGIAIGRDGARHVVDSGPDRIVTFSPVSQL